MTRMPTVTVSLRTGQESGTIATQTKLNNINVSHILRHIWLHRGPSRHELSKAVSMDKSTVTKIVAQLLDIGIVRTSKTEARGTRVGRKPIPIDINLEYGCIIGLEIKTDSYAAVIIDLNGEVLFKAEHELEFDGKLLVEVFEEIVSWIRPQAEKVNLRVLGICVGVSGLVDYRCGVIRMSNPLQISSPIAFKAEAEKRVGVPVFVENDANCGCWGELAIRRAGRSDSMLYVLGEFRETETRHTFYPGVGVGFGLVIDGRVLQGSDFSVGEFKSVFCGDEPTISQFSLPDRDVERIETKPVELDRLLDELCRNIAYTVNILDLDEVVIGGSFAKYEHLISPKLDHLVRANWLHPHQVKYEIRYSKLDGLSVCYGAACVFLESLFGVPDVSEATTGCQLRGIELLKQIG